ncbi:MAG: hypothetical protein EBZ47_04825 [Chlamydiae bacterium]|nr:hypothetical protein [Chlamydiota bacterium]
MITALYPLFYFFSCIIFFPLRFLSYRSIHRIGNFLGLCSYYLAPPLRKRALTNLALAKELKLSNDQIIKYAKESIQNLAITCLEYEKFFFEKHIHKIASCVNPEEAKAILDSGKGVIFFCGHQANWEVLFLEGTLRMPGVAIGRPIKNQHIYKKGLSIREKFGGKIVPPKNAFKEGLRALKQGKFFGIVGDQGMPDSGFCSNFLGRNAWTSPLPALLSYRTQCPIIVATTVRKDHHYFITYSKPIWPDVCQPIEKETTRLMNIALSIFSQSIQENPGQWLWIHNRWKQKKRGTLLSKYRKDSITVIIPNNPSREKDYLEILQVLRDIYDQEYLILWAPKAFKNAISTNVDDLILYERESECFQKNFKVKLLINLTNNPLLSLYYKILSASSVITLSKISKTCRNFQSTSWESKLELLLKKN